MNKTSGKKNAFRATNEGPRQLEGQRRGRPKKTTAILYYFIHNFKDDYEVRGSRDYSDNFFHAFFSVSNVVTNKLRSLVRLIVFLTVSAILSYQRLLNIHNSTSLPRPVLKKKKPQNTSARCCGL